MKKIAALAHHKNVAFFQFAGDLTMEILNPNTLEKFDELQLVD